MGNKEAGIYLIDKSKLDSKTNEKIVNEIMNIAKIKKGYNNMEIEKSTINGYNIKLYNCISPSVDTWDSFFDIKTSMEGSYVNESMSNNYIAFIYKENNIFCITTNKAYNDINKYVVHFYGVYIMSQFMKPEDNIRSVTYNNIMSNFLGGSEYLGESFEFTLSKYWNRINTNLMAEIDKNRLYKELNMENKGKKLKVRCGAKDNFTVCSKMSLEEIIKIVKSLDAISNTSLVDKFNNIKKIKEDNKIKMLDEQLVSKMYNDFTKKTLDVCIIHKNIDAFFKSMEYRFMYEDDAIHECDTIPNQEDLLTCFEKLQINSIAKMEDALEKIYLRCFESDKVLLSDELKSFLNISLEHNEKNYIFQHQIWYELTDNYIETLDESFEFIKSTSEENEIAFEKWGNESEGDYINKYESKTNFYKMHPKLEDGIEICDLMYIDRAKNTIKILYLKKGFGASTRDLSIQTSIGIKRMTSILQNESRLQKMYEKYIKPKNASYQYTDFKNDIKKFYKYAIIVYKLNDNETEQSNIGKQSIISAKNEVEAISKCKFLIKKL